MKINYRPEIDGLRAIAIISVLIYHYSFIIIGNNFLSGGYLGVDIFFTISGYLITLIILKELRIYQRFSFINFYKRRAKRILPALLVLIIILIPIMCYILMPISLSNFLKSSLSSLFFSSNFFFYFTGLEYGTEESWFKPLLHTWSLSVEEQFYIFFPIILFFFYKKYNKYLLYIFFLGIILSLGIAQYASTYHPALNFYILPTRAWELLAGSVLAYCEINYKKKFENKLISEIFIFFGLILIVGSIVYFNKNTDHPSIITIIPVAGAAIIIWFGNQKLFLIKLLSLKPIVFIGLISYSLYLWHFPIFSIVKITGTNNNYILIILITFLSSILSYYLVENNFRNKILKFKNIFYFIIFAYFLILITSILLLKNFSFLFKNYPEILLKENLALQTRFILKKNNEEICFPTTDINKQCIFNKNGQRTVHLVGDSLMASIAHDLVDHLTKKNLKITLNTKKDCLFYPEYSLFDKVSKKFTDCNSKYFNDLLNIFLENKNDIIILFGRWDIHFNEDIEKKSNKTNLIFDKKYISETAESKKLGKTFIEYIKKLNNDILIVYPLHHFDIPVAYQISNINKFSKQNIDPNKIIIFKDYLMYKEQTLETYKILDSIKGSNIYKVYPHKLFCNNINFHHKCLGNSLKELYFSDSQHPSLSGSKLISNIISLELDKMLEKNK